MLCNLISKMNSFHARYLINTTDMLCNLSPRTFLNKHAVMLRVSWIWREFELPGHPEHWAALIEGKNEQWLRLRLILDLVDTAFCLKVWLSFHGCQSETSELRMIRFRGGTTAVVFHAFSSVTVLEKMSVLEPMGLQAEENWQIILTKKSKNTLYM